MSMIVVESRGEVHMSLVVWGLSIAVSVAGLVLTAASGLHMAHLAICAVVTLLMAIVAIRDMRIAEAAGATEGEIAAMTARNMGLVWTWGALALVVTYAFILDWHEWWQFALAFGAAACLSIFFANLLKDETDPSSTLMTYARYLMIAQLVGMAATVIGLLIDGKMTRYQNAQKFQDWAANNIFMFGAIALGAISLMAFKRWRANVQ